jgi:16S rRNA (cytosine967-C5)-methyltransferase
MKSKQHRFSPSPARRTAFDILNRVENEGAYASNLIAQLPPSSLSREDRALAQEIVLGVLRWQSQLDYFVERYSRRDTREIDCPVLIALRMGIYQLRRMTRIPPSAAVNESVNLVKTARVASAAGMVNATLRNATRHLDDSGADDISDPITRSSIEASHPRWMLERWINAYGYDEALRLAMSNNESPQNAFRVNTLRSSIEEVLRALESEGVSVRSSDVTSGAFVVVSGPSTVIARLAQSGLIYIQDEASQLAPQLLDPKPDEVVLDLCAAPGSKASQIAAITEDRAWVVACDIHTHRLANLRSICRRLGIESIDSVACDAMRELPFDVSTHRFNRVLLDAPCSGTGTLRRNPEIKWRLSYEDLIRLAELQAALLARAVEATAVGGRIVYSTCSIEPEENEEVVGRLLASSARVKLITPAIKQEMLTSGGFIRTFPHRDRTDGFFMAVLERTPD